MSQRRGISINHTDPEVTLAANIPGTLTRVATITTPDKQLFTVYNGDLLVMQLQTAVPAQIPGTSRIVISAERPGRELPTQIDVNDYLVWSVLDINDQYDSNRNSQCRLHLARGKIDLPETHSLIIMVDSPELIDWGESMFALQLDYNPFRDVR